MMKNYVYASDGLSQEDAGRDVFSSSGRVLYRAPTSTTYSGDGCFGEECNGEETEAGCVTMLTDGSSLNQRDVHEAKSDSQKHRPALSTAIRHV